MPTPRPPRLSRRSVLQLGALGLSGAAVGVFNRAAETPIRLAARTPAGLPEVQFHINDFLAPVETVDGTLFRFGPVYTVFRTARLRRLPTRRDQRVLADALDAIEATHAFRPSGIFTTIAYGQPYLDRLPAMLVAEHVPRLSSDPARPAFQEAVPAPTDVHTSNPGVTKLRFNQPVRIEDNDLLLTLRSDSLDVVLEVIGWLAGSDRLGGRRSRSPDLGLLDWTSTRVMFSQRGMPRRLADQQRLPFAHRVHPESPMWMGFSDQQVEASGPPDIVTFRGTDAARLTTARRGDYLADASVQHLSHVIQDLEQFYLGAEPGPEGEEDASYLNRVTYMFRMTPPPHRGNADQHTDGGGPAFLPNEFRGVEDAERGAAGIGTPEGIRRIGHVTALQRSSRAPDGTPLHIRTDGPGFDDMDIPGGTRQPKLQFSIFVPTADVFARMRRDGAAVDLAAKHRVPAADNGLERFITATRRQNFLVPPRSRRTFPLLELT